VLLGGGEAFSVDASLIKAVASALRGGAAHSPQDIITVRGEDRISW
jgi:hypothetical protein